MMKKSFFSSNRPLLVCLAVAVLLCLWSSVFSLARGRDVLRGAMVTVSSPFVRVFDKLGGSIAERQTATRLNYEAWLEQKAELESRLAEQQKLLEQLQGLKQENEQLRDYLSLREEHRTLMLTEARVIYTSDTTARTLTLNKGSRDGISVGMPVINATGLVGTVSEVSKTTCKISTLLSESVYIGVRNVRSGVSGTLCGTEDGQNACVLQYLDPNIQWENDLRVGDIVVTSGYGERYPSGLMVGKITKVMVDAYDRTPYAYVEPVADVRDTDALLMIVTGEEIETPDPEDDEASGEQSSDESQQIPQDEPDLSQKGDSELQEEDEA